MLYAPEKQLCMRSNESLDTNFFFSSSLYKNIQNKNNKNNKNKQQTTTTYRMKDLKAYNRNIDVSSRKNKLDKVNECKN